jgi:hypothetical protein
VEMKAQVHSLKFLRQVISILYCLADWNDDGMDSPCCLNVYWTHKSTTDDNLPKGSRIIVAEPKIQSTKQRYRTGASTCAEIKKKCLKDWDQFMSFIESPASIPTNDFDLVIKRLSSFHVIRPITERCYMQETRTMLIARGYKLIPLHEIEERQKGRAFWSCSCTNYLQYAWCEHAAAMAMANEIVTGIPPRMDPRTLPCTKRPPGRPRNAKGGTSREVYKV